MARPSTPASVLCRGALTGRVGYAVDRMLLYVKGGSAWGRQTNQFNTFGRHGGALLTQKGPASRSGLL